MTRGRRVKRVVQAGTTVHQRTISWAGSVDHVTCMTIVSASGILWTPAFVLPGVLARFRRHANGKWEPPADFLPQSNYMLMREVAGVGSDIFYYWARSFILETSFLRANGKKMLLKYDGYGSHCTYRVLQLFKYNGIVVVSIRSDSSTTRSHIRQRNPAKEHI